MLRDYTICLGLKPHHGNIMESFFKEINGNFIDSPILMGLTKIFKKHKTLSIFRHVKFHVDLSPISLDLVSQTFKIQRKINLHGFQLLDQLQKLHIMGQGLSSSSISGPRTLYTYTSYLLRVVDSMLLHFNHLHMNQILLTCTLCNILCSCHLYLKHVTHKIIWHLWLQKQRKLYVDSFQDQTLLL